MRTAIAALTVTALLLAPTQQEVAPRFGAVETYHAPEIADEVGVGWTRIIFYWSELEREGPDDWNTFHAPLDRIDREIAGGREVVGLLQSTPEWATDGQAGAGVPRGLYLPIDDPENLWANFVREVVSRYAGRVDRWIIWNEPDIELGTYGALWEGTTEDYYRLLQVAYLAAHEVNSDVQIHLGGITYWHDPGWMRSFLEVATAAGAEHDHYFDVVTLHIYFKPETTLGIVADTRAALEEFGLEKPIWINETNAMPFDDPQHPWVEPVFEVTLEMQADFLLQQFAIALSMDVERIAVYKWVEEPPRPPGYEPFGLLRTDRSARPAFEAYRTVVEQYAGTRSALRFERPDFMQIVLDRGNSTTRVIWARTPHGLVVDMPALAGDAAIYRADGSRETRSAEAGLYRLALPGASCSTECLMGGSPLVIVEEVSPPLDHPERLSARTVAATAPGESPLDAEGLRTPITLPQVNRWLMAGILLAAVGAWVAVTSGRT